ncbi:hypothetical protein [Moraxella lacunata]|uniref:hypothetical protein n=1 Tax=Moraxella lacunata TaxID=477 RepID=UPI003F5B4438
MPRLTRLPELRRLSSHLTAPKRFRQLIMACYQSYWSERVMMLKKATCWRY